MKKWTSIGVKKLARLNIKMYKVMHRWVPNTYSLGSKWLKVA